MIHNKKLKIHKNNLKMIKYMKENIRNKLPNNNSELSWITKECGKLLFKGKWQSFTPLEI